MSLNKHPFVGSKVKKTSTIEELELAKEIAYDKFSVHIENCFEDKDNCYNVNNKQCTKCECFFEIFEGENKSKACTFISELAIKDASGRNKVIEQIIGCGDKLAKLQQTPNSNSFTLKLDDVESINFCKNTAQVILDVGRRKYASIIKNYGLANPNTTWCSREIS